MRPALLLLPLLLQLLQRADAAGMNTHTMVRFPIHQTLDRYFSSIRAGSLPLRLTVCRV